MNFPPLVGEHADHLFFLYLQRLSAQFQCFFGHAQDTFRRGWKNFSILLQVGRGGYWAGVMFSRGRCCCQCTDLFEALLLRQVVYPCCQVRLCDWLLTRIRFRGRRQFFVRWCFSRSLSSAARSALGHCWRSDGSVFPNPKALIAIRKASRINNSLCAYGINMRLTRIGGRHSGGVCTSVNASKNVNPRSFSGASISFRRVCHSISFGRVCE